jgi:hypothetical protein
MFWNASFKRNYNIILDIDDPFPEIELEISHCYLSNRLTLDRFTIDTGAGRTCINFEIFDILDLEYYTTWPVEYADDGRADQHTCLVDMSIPQLNFKEKQLEVFVHPRGTENLLGRDVLNKMSVFLYGRKQMFKIKL